MGPFVFLVEERPFRAVSAISLTLCRPERAGWSVATDGESKDREDAGVLNAASGSSQENLSPRHPERAPARGILLRWPQKECRIFIASGEL
jgi:hypothetical protein